MIDRMLNSRFNWPGTLFLIVLVIAWEIAAQLAGSRIFPPVSAVAQVFVNDGNRIVTATWHTLLRAMTGFAIALVLMLPLGILLGRVRVLGEIVEPVIEFLRPVPPIAIVPLAMMTLGIGDEAKLLIVVYGACFPIVINAIDAVKVQDPMQSRLARSLRLTTLERMVFIDLPAALPRIFGGIRTAISVAVLLSVVSEIILSTNGLGSYLRLGQSSFRMANVIAAIVAIALVSVLVNALANWAHRRLLDWHYRKSALAGR